VATVIYTFVIDNYFPELCELTIPNIKRYANKIGADFVKVTERKFPTFPPTYEKIQVHELGKNNEWNILIDADFLIHPNTPDVRTVTPKDRVGFDWSYDANTCLNVNDSYFKRDGRNLGVVTSFVVSHSIVHDFWTPLEFGFDEAKKKIKHDHIIDEYCVSRNLAKFGLKHIGLFQKFPEQRGSWLVHLNVKEGSKEDIINKAKNLIGKWNGGRVICECIGSYSSSG